MSTQNWIKMSERKPRNVEFPIWASTKAGNVVLYDKDESYFILECPEFATHWRPAAADIPAPPKEETQANKDADAFSVFHNSDDGYSGNTAGVWHMAFRAYWHAALAYERAEVAKFLPISEPATYNALYATDVIRAIRARCGGAK